MKKTDYVLAILICLFCVLLSTTMSLVKAEDPIDVSITLNASFESQNVMEKSYRYDENNEKVFHEYWNYVEQIKNFYINNEIEEINEYAYKFDVSEEDNGRVVAYLVTNQDDSNYYDLYLQADGIIYPNSDMRFYFDGMLNVDMINNMSGFDTSEVTNMKGLFQKTGYNSEKFALDVSGWNTSNVENMSGMFNKTGYNSKFINLDLRNFNTSKVTTMEGMFQKTGYNSPNFTIDVSNFDTSKVTNMCGIFNQTGFNSKKFELDVSSFDTSNVTDMSNMFVAVGKNNPNFTLDVSNFDTSKVTDMSWMFGYIGYNNPNFTLDVSSFDTSNVIDMDYMFRYAGYNSENFTLDVSNFDTSKVTDMSYMFADTGYNSTIFNIDLSGFDTSNVTNMEAMFYNTGINSTELDTSITIKNPNTVYKLMFVNSVPKEGSQIKVNYIKDTEELVAKMIATKSSNSNVVKGNLIVDVDNLSIGDEIHISGEKFNIISQTDDTVTMLTQLNLGTDYKQSATSNYVTFSDSNGWNTPGERELDIQISTTNPKTYINAYVEYLKTELGDNSITGDLITLKELKSLGCTIPTNNIYNSNGWTCANSSYKLWLNNDMMWWTRSYDSSTTANRVWLMNAEGDLSATFYNRECGIRPIITISKETLRNLK